MLLIPQSTFATMLFERYSKITENPHTKIKSIVLDVVNQLILTNSATINNKAVGNDIAYQSIASPATTTMVHVDLFFNNQPAVSTNIVFVGETHKNLQDENRANQMLGAVDAAAAPTPGYIVFERGLPYGGVNNAEMIREMDLTTGIKIPSTFHHGLDIADRSYIVAGYLVARAACGNQNAKNNIMLFFGAMHNDIPTFFETIARQCGSADHVLKLPRNYNLIDSNNP